MTKDEMKNRISMALKDPILQQGFEIICKENAELEDKLNNLASVAEVRLANWQKSEKENAELKEEMRAKQVVLNDFKSRVETVTDRFNRKSSQLAKAKEIIKKLVEDIRIISDPQVELTDVDSFVAEAEVFLSGSENPNK